MTKNPLMALFDPIERLITEHGSAAIQGKHIALLKDEIAILKEKFLVLSAEKEKTDRENKELETENQNLINENKNLRQEIQRHDDIIQKEKSHANLLNVSRMKWGCITFPPDNKLYCPSCFHTNGKKIETSRVDVHNRYCAVCKTKIPSG